MVGLDIGSDDTQSDINSAVFSTLSDKKKGLKHLASRIRKILRGLREGLAH